MRNARVICLLAFALCLAWALGLWPWALLSAQQPARDTPVRPPPATGSGTIAGTVVTDETPSQPVRKARVMLNAADRSIPGRTVTTDDAGRFAFRDLPDGRFTLRAEKPAHIAVNYGAKRPGRTGTPISIAPNQKIVDLVMRMSRGGVITGAVRDQSGLPASGVDVYVMRYDYSPTTGTRMLSWESISRTDDQGVYRAWGLPPGEYVVVANPGPDSRIPAGGRPGTGLEEIRRLSAAEVQRAIAVLQAGRVGGASAPRNEPQLLPPAPPVNYAPVFHPGTTNLARALSISLSTAEEQTGVDVQIQLVPTAAITGSCVLPSDVQPQTISVTLAYESPIEIRQGFGMPSTRTSRLSPDGQFSFSGITPGRYTVLAKTLEPGGAGSGRGRVAPPGRRLAKRRRRRAGGRWLRSTSMARISACRWNCGRRCRSPAGSSSTARCHARTISLACGHSSCLQMPAATSPPVRREVRSTRTAASCSAE
jgi:protocatechuate 3,4-dioxygenase beta subunit